MKTLIFGSLIAAASLGIATTADREPLGADATLAVHANAAPAVDLAPATLNEIVMQYCVVCHNDALLTGNVSLQSFQVENAAAQADIAERMIRKLRAGMMPPPGAPRSSGPT